MFDHGLPEEPSRDDISAFYDTLAAMETADLKKLEIATYPKWARRVMDAERCRRKEQGGADTTPSSKDRIRIITLGTPKPQGQNKKKGKKKKRDEVDGEYLHEAVAAEAPFQLVYDASLSKNRHRSVRDMAGTFTCTHCKKPHAWDSSVIATQVWFDEHRDRYCTLLNCQKCKRCNQYAKLEINEEKYVDRLLNAITLWKGLRERRMNPDVPKKTGPHDSTRCRGCEKGICGQRASRNDSHCVLSLSS